MDILKKDLIPIIFLLAMSFIFLEVIFFNKTFVFNKFVKLGAKFYPLQ